MFNPVLRAIFFKDLNFISLHVVVYALIGLISIVINLIPGQTASFMSSILTITAFMVFYCHLIMKSVVAEKKESNDLFLMTLPVSARQLYFFKLGFNVLIFTLMWLLYVAALAAVVMTSDHMPAVVLSIYLLVFSVVIPAFFFILTVSLITRSEGWTIIALVFSNVVSTITFNMVSSSDDITSAFSRGTFSEIGFVWPPWSIPFFGVMAGIAFVAITASVFKGLLKKYFF